MQKNQTTKKKKELKRRKRTALIICQDGKRFWATQGDFWQWVRECRLKKIKDNPLTGVFLREHEELTVVLSNTVLNLAHPNHLREALHSRRLGLSKH